MLRKIGLFVAVAMWVGPQGLLDAAWHKKPAKVAELRRNLDVYIQAQWAENHKDWLPQIKRHARVLGHPVAKGQASAEVIILYIHGYMPFRATPSQAAHLFAPLEGTLRGVRYSLCSPGLDCSRKYASFAQGFDVYQVEQHLERLIAERAKSFPDIPIICVGHSNGASTLISTLCKNEHLRDKIAGVVLLAPYADIVEAFPLAKIPKVLGGKTTARKALKVFAAPNHDKTLLSPLQYIERGMYSVDLPTLLAHPRKDTIVPYKNFEMLQKAFSEKGTNVQFLTLSKDKHFFRRPSSELKDELRCFIEKCVGEKHAAST